MGPVIVVKSKSHLLQIILTLTSPGCFACLLDCWQQQRDQHSDNGDDDQQFDESETTVA